MTPVDWCQERGVSMTLLNQLMSEWGPAQVDEDEASVL
jgi:hypothetical protein